MTKTTSRESRKTLARGVLTRSAWLQGLDDAPIDTFVENGELVEVTDGCAVCRKGESIQHFSCLIEGVLDVSLTSKTGKRHLLVCLEPGQPVNVIALLDGLPATHDVYSRGDSLVLDVPRQLFLDEMERSQRFYRLVVRLICTRARTFYDAYAATALLSLRSRCAHQLLSLASAYGLPRDGSVQISLKLSQDTFSEMLGCARQSVNVELKRLEREGVITMSYSHFSVLQPLELARIARGDDEL